MKIRDAADEDNNNNSHVQVVVFVTNARGSEIASKLTGYFVIKGQEFNFTAIAFGRIGGHNISLRISKKTLEKIIEGLQTDGFLPDR